MSCAPDCFGLISNFCFSPVVVGGHLENERSGNKDRFADVDGNGDNKINCDEFVALAEKNFAKMDKPGDGVVSKGEMRWRKEKGYGDL